MWNGTKLLHVSRWFLPVFQLIFQTWRKWWTEGATGVLNALCPSQLVLCKAHLRTPSYDGVDLCDVPGQVCLLHLLRSSANTQRLCSSQLTSVPWWCLNTVLLASLVIPSSKFPPVGQIQLQSSLRRLDSHVFPRKNLLPKCCHSFLPCEEPLPCTSLESLTHTLTHTWIYPA